LTGCLAFFLSACGGALGPPPPVSTSSPTAPPTEEVHQEAVVFPTGDYDNPIPDIGTKFTLTAAQQALFDTYSKDFNFDISVFKGAAPVDVAQVYIECGNEGLWEGEYNLFYLGAAKITKAQYKAGDEQDLSTRDIRTRRDYANLVFPMLNDGKFTDNGDGSGYIEFDSVESTSDYQDIVNVKAKMNLQQVNGIWLINYNKIFETETETASETASQ